MIDVRELRIGNNILDNGIVFQVTAATIMDIVQYRIDYDPIPLTPEILDKCGFKKLQSSILVNSYFIELSDDKILSIHYVGTDDEIVFLSEQKDGKINATVLIREYCFEGKTYLHQLQNISYFLTNTELNFKP